MALPEDERLYAGVPDPSSHRWGWKAAKCDGVWCVGMDGNLDTKYDATIQVTGGWQTDDECREVAEFIAAAYNHAIAEGKQQTG